MCRRFAPSNRIMYWFYPRMKSLCDCVSWPLLAMLCAVTRIIPTGNAALRTGFMLMWRDIVGILSRSISTEARELPLGYRRLSRELWYCPMTEFERFFVLSFLCGVSTIAMNVKEKPEFASLATTLMMENTQS